MWYANTHIETLSYMEHALPTFGALGSNSDKKITCAMQNVPSLKNARAKFLIFTFRLEKQQLLFSNAKAIVLQ